MVKRKNFIRCGALCAVLLLCGLLVFPAVVPVSAAGDGVLSNEYFSPYTFSAGWIGQDASQNLVNIYARELPFAFTTDVAETWHGTTTEGEPTKLADYSAYVVKGAPNKVEQVVSFDMEVPTLVFNHNRMLFVSRSQGLPLFSVCDVDVIMDVEVAASGYWIVRESNPVTGAFTQRLDPFTLSISGTADPETFFVCSNVLKASDMQYDAIVTNLRVSCTSAERDSHYYLNNVWATMELWSDSELSQNSRDLRSAMDVAFQAVPASEITVDFVDWITTAISAFWSFELVPGITIEGIVYACLGVGLLVMFLKYFSGG